MAGVQGSATTRKQQLIRKLAGLIVRGVYRRVDVVRTDDVVNGPQMSVSNHFGGFSDPLLLVYAMPRLPRIIARDVIWQYPVVGWLMRWVGAIPVHKPEDRGPGSNDAMFASAYEGLEEGASLMIFPEGITRDEPSIARIKTGAARIVLGAREKGVTGIKITPAGIHYEDKAALRSSVSVHVGRPLDLDADISTFVEPGADTGPSNRTAVRSLTDEIEQRLRRVAPDFGDWEEARTMTHGAEILLRTLADEPAADPPLAARDAIANHLGRKPDSVKTEVVTAVSHYERLLSDLGVTDAELLSGMTGGRLLRRLIGRLLLSIVLLPFALVGAAINWIPYLIVKGVGLLRVAPAVQATIKPMTAIVAFGLTWGVVVWGVSREYGLGGAMLAVLLIPVYLAAVIVFSERVAGLWTALQAWRGLRAASGSEDIIAATRREVVGTLVRSL